MSCLGKREVDFELFQNGTLVEWCARKILKKKRKEKKNFFTKVEF